jgi:hypothetical protein
MPLAIVIFALLARGPSEAALHPTGLSIQNAGRWQAVGSVPETEVPQNYRLDRASDFAPGSVQIASERIASGRAKQVVTLATAETDTGAGSETAPPAAGLEYDFELTAAQLPRGAYFAVALFDRDLLSQGDDSVPPILLLREIAGFVPGRPLRLGVNLDCLDFRNGTYVAVPMIFIGGSEIRSNRCDAEARLFRRFDEARHERALARYRREYADADRDLSPFLQFAPAVVPVVVRAPPPAHAEAIFTVGEDGLVNDLTFDAPLAPELAQTLSRAICGWSFYPRLERGMPVATRVHLPLAFALR